MLFSRGGRLDKDGTGHSHFAKFQHSSSPTDSFCLAQQNQSGEESASTSEATQVVGRSHLEVEGTESNADTDAFKPAETSKKPKKSKSKGKKSKKKIPRSKMTPKQRALAEIKYFLSRLIAMAVILYVMFGLVFGITSMGNMDMQPKIQAGDLMLFYRLDRDYQIGEVLIYEKDGRNYTGRVVAKEGDKVDISSTEKRMIINGNTIIESDIFFQTGEYEGGVELPLTVPKQSYFLLADYREGGKDSRYFGPIPKSEIKGKVFTVIRRSHL